MEIDWGLLFGAVLNFFLLVGLMGLVVSYVKKPTIAKKRALVVLAVLVLIGTLGNFIKNEQDCKWFKDSDLAYGGISIGMTEKGLLTAQPCDENNITIINDNTQYLCYDDYNVYVYENKVTQITIKQTNANTAIFGLEIGDSLENVKAKLPAELDEWDQHDSEIHKPPTNKDYGFLVNFYANNKWEGLTICIYSQSGKSYVMVDFDDDLSVSEIRYGYFSK